MKWLYAAWIYVRYLWELFISRWKKPPRIEVPFTTVTTSRFVPQEETAVPAPTLDELVLPVPSMKESGFSMPVVYRAAPKKPLSRRR